MKFWLEIAVALFVATWAGVILILLLMGIHDLIEWLQDRWNR